MTQNKKKIQNPNIALNSDIIYANIQSLYVNSDQLITDINCYKPSVVLLSEAQTTTDIENFEIRIDGYKMIRCDSTSSYTGGVVIYVKKNLSYSVKKLHYC